MAANSWLVIVVTCKLAMHEGLTTNNKINIRVKKYSTTSNNGYSKRDGSLHDAQRGV